MTLDGKVALVTGAASGIGKATATLFGKAGAKVVVADVQDEAGETVAKGIRDAGGEAFYQHCDVGDEAQVQAMVGAAEERFGGLDIAFNNAGIEGETGLLADQSRKNWDRTLAIDLTGVYLCLHHEVPALRRRGGGAIVNMSSVAGLVGLPGSSPYGAAKHGVIGLTRDLAIELAQDGIRVNAVCPGAIQTPMIDRYVAGNEQAREELVRLHPLGRLGTPEEVAGPVVFLCSDQASFITGQALAIDGGWTAQ